MHCLRNAHSIFNADSKDKEKNDILLGLFVAVIGGHNLIEGRHHWRLKWVSEPAANLCMCMDVVMLLLWLLFQIFRFILVFFSSLRCDFKKKIITLANLGGFGNLEMRFYDGCHWFHQANHCYSTWTKSLSFLFHWAFICLFYFILYFWIA